MKMNQVVLLAFILSASSVLAAWFTPKAGTDFYAHANHEFLLGYKEYKGVSGYSTARENIERDISRIFTQESTSDVGALLKEFYLSGMQEQETAESSEVIKTAIKQLLATSTIEELYSVNNELFKKGLSATNWAFEQSLTMEDGENAMTAVPPSMYASNSL
jgi:hypothetical protein